MTGEKPFVLLDDAREEDAAPARLYRDPVQISAVFSMEDLEGLWALLRKARQDGLHVAGYLSYEAGLALEGRLLDRMKSNNATSAAQTPLAWFGIFNDYKEIESNEVLDHLPDPAGAWLGKLRPGVSREDYDAAFEKVQDYIRAGDIYQANLTFRAAAKWAGHPLALYAAVRERAKAGYGGVVFDGQNWMLSFSPELFFALKDGRITAKPMKGTAARDADDEADKAAQELLQADPKQRAENLMIVDLLRNDLSRVAKSGSVEVPELFHIESYPTVHQMTSTVTAELDEGCDVVDVLRQIFPCGSITGAPKIRAMEIIDELEVRTPYNPPSAKETKTSEGSERSYKACKPYKSNSQKSGHRRELQAGAKGGPRGIYCGSIGRIDPNGDAAFNVAIRTFHLSGAGGDAAGGDKRLSIGVGSGIVADSKGHEEWRECLAKGRFADLTGGAPKVDLIETMAFDPAQGIARLELHLERMKASAAALEFEFDRHAARNTLQAVTFHQEEPAMVRLMLAKSGAVAIQLKPIPEPLEEPVQCQLVELKADPADYRLHHKTSDRRAYKVEGLGEGVHPVFVDSEGLVTEGAIWNVFVERDGKLLTPPASRGLLPGVLRRELLEAGRAVEADLRPEDVALNLLVGNSVRGLITAKIF